MLKRFQAIFHPERFQGWGKTREYFEGWYFKVINADESRAFAFIPGIAMDKNGQKHAFIQLLDGKKSTAEYHKFDIAEFHPFRKQFEIAIGNNLFSSEQFSLNLPSAAGKLSFTSLSPWPSSWYSPGIMGPFSFVPFMECYHGILSMNHGIEGQLIIHGEKIDFTGGWGYMEKDWGNSFPNAYIWMQTNHFSEPDISFKCSVANIPWLGSSFVGYIAGVKLQDRLIQFTTYNGTKLLKSFADNHKVEIVMENKHHRLEVLAHRDKVTQLASPISGFMTGRIEESMTSKIEILLTDIRNKNILLNDNGRNAGLEVAGNIKSLFK
jgi:hypothetical protein